MTTAGLTPTSTETLGAAATVTADQAPGAFWSEIATADGIQRALVESVRDLLAGTHYSEHEVELRDAGITAVDGTIAGVVKALDLPPEHERHQQALETIARFGSEETIIGDIALEEVADGPVAILEAADRVPTVAVHVDEEFQGRRRDQREQICQLIATLATAVDVRLVATGLTQRWLAREHREDLPGVSEWCNEQRGSGPLGDLVDSALADLDPDGRDIKVLRTVADEPAETLSYSQLYALFPEIDTSRIRQCITRLVGHELIATFGPQSDQKVELLEAGRELLSVLDAEIGRQVELSDAVRKNPKTDDRPCNPAHGMGGEGVAEPYTTAHLSRADHAAGAACGLTGGVTLVDGPVKGDEAGANDRARYVSYDDRRDEAVVAVRATGALQHVVSVATALADPMLLDKALPTDRLESITLSEAILRDGRCIGSLSDDALEDPDELRKALVEWGNDLESLTTDLKRRDYDGDRDDFRSTIMRSAHGLAGSIVHLLDVAGVDIVREIRVPSGLNDRRLTGLVESIATAAAIQSRYGHNAAYRHLFEPRADKRQQALPLEVDAEDPFGQLIGGIVIRGPGVDRLRPHLETRLGSDEDLVEDAPEFTVNITVRDVSREDFATTAARILSAKNLSLTRETTSLLHGLVGSPHAAARALQQLGAEDRPRELHPDEVRYALATLDARHLLPDLPPSVGAIVLTLLEATDALTQTELADRADVSTQTVRNYRDELEVLGLVETGGGYRLTLSTREERDEAIVPALVENGTLLEAVDALLEATLSPERYADRDDPLGGVLYWPQEPWALADHDTFAPWLEVGARLTAATRPETETVVSMGPTLEQQPLPTADSTPEVTASD